MDYKKLADLLFPNLPLTTQEIEKKYPPRKIKEGEIVSRYAPSPTGFMHLGNFFQMFISYALAKSSNGVEFLRLEDTDAKREKAEAKEVIYQILNHFGIKFNEYQTLDGKDIGAYGPYVQSQRADIYKAYAKKLVSEGKAFPCFCKKTEGKEDVVAQRAIKFKNDDEKEYDPCRNLTLEQVEEKLKANKPFAIRLKTKNDGSQRIVFNDLLKGDIEAKANAKDFILLKSDGIPPYAFAHAIDDTLMGTNLVVRGEEYISSTPAHLELFDALGFKHIQYCHNPLICKIDENGNRRKLSKRLDVEADMRYYITNGYPNDSIFEYLLTLLSSSFENWRSNNPNTRWQEFKFTPSNITAVAPICDLVKLNDISKTIISKMSASEVYENVLTWANEFDKPFAEYLTKNKKYAICVFNIDRETPKPRKDIYCWSMVKEYFSYMWNAPQTNELEDADETNYKEFIKAYADNFKLASSKEDWFNGVKELADKLGYATDNKLYKANPEAYKGNTAKACEFIRLALTGHKNSPDLYEIMTILGENEVKSRLNAVK
ncbi:MAG: glutamate--tRNA ligase [Clostridia bacterium]|nr:glutamate--tRNA ligase [Clostridia bacterium]